MLYLILLTVVLAAVAAFIYTKWKKDLNLRLLIKLRGEIKTAEFGGFCYQIEKLHHREQKISHEEYLWLKNFILDKTPPFYKNLKDERKLSLLGYWWLPIEHGEKYRQIRIDFLNKLIKEF